MIALVILFYFFIGIEYAKLYTIPNRSTLVFRIVVWPLAMLADFFRGGG